MSLPNLDELLTELEQVKSESRMARWLNLQEPETVDWFWGLMKTFYHEGGRDFSETVRIARVHLPDFPLKCNSAVKKFVDDHFAP